MDSGRCILAATFVLYLHVASVARVLGSGACFEFTGDGQVSFSPANLDISSKYGTLHMSHALAKGGLMHLDNPLAHFKLSFNTASDTGLLYYAEGTYQSESVYDYEGVFLHDGYLHYFLFNPAEYGIGSSFGFHGKSKSKLNDGKWHTVEFYRNIEMSIVDRYGGTEQVEQTGLKVDGVQQAVDNRRRVGVNIFRPIILGRDPHQEDRVGPTIGGFKGRIKDFVDLIRNHPFDQPNSMKTQVRHCLSSPPDPV